MPRARRILRAEFKPMVRLAGPVVVAEIGWVGMGIVDTIMVGRLGPVAIGAVGIGSILFMALAIFGMGLLLGLDTLVSQAFGAGRLDDCHRWLVHALALTLLVALPMLGLARAGIWSLPYWGLDPDVLRLAEPYLTILTLSLLPLLFYAALRRYLQALGLVGAITFALVSANIINALGNWVLVFGHAGFPALGTRGSAWATVTSRVYLVVVLVIAVVRCDARHHVSLFDVPWRIEAARLTRLVRLGLPAATQVTLELGVFAAATALAGRLDPVSLAAHQIVLSLASFTFMVPLGIASAGAVRVGHAVGRRDPTGAAQAGWTALSLGVGFMALAAASFVLFPVVLVRLFTTSQAVIAVGVTLLLVGAMFQVFDGVQGVATGVLRGAGDTKTPMLTNLAAHWGLGLPVGYALCFRAHWGVVGLWVGLSLGLIVVALVLLAAWTRRVQLLRASLGA
jgi:MATE family multidrug resistance protein